MKTALRLLALPALIIASLFAGAAIDQVWQRSPTGAIALAAAIALIVWMALKPWGDK